jgi:hypothetical protein
MFLKGWNKLKKTVLWPIRWMLSNQKKSYKSALIILALLTIAAFAYAVMFPITHRKSSLQKGIILLPQELVDPMGVYSISVPKDWVTQPSIAKPPKADGFMALAPVSRIQEYRKQYGGDLVHTTAALYRSNDKAKAWFEKQSFLKPSIAQEMVLNGYDVYAATIILPDSTESMYVISHNGYVVHFVFKEKAKTYNPDKEFDYSKDVYAYDRIVTSIKFLK